MFHHHCKLSSLLSPGEYHICFEPSASLAKLGPKLSVDLESGTAIDYTKVCTPLPSTQLRVSFWNTLLQAQGPPDHLRRMIKEIYDSTPSTVHILGQEREIQPAWGVKEGCLLSLMLLVGYYELLLRGLPDRCPQLKLRFYLDNIVILALDKPTLEGALDGMPVNPPPEKKTPPKNKTPQKKIRPPLGGPTK